MKKHLQHPTYTAYYRDLQRELFVLDHGKEYGDNLFIETRTDSQVAERTTLAAIKANARATREGKKSIGLPFE